jgi:NAD-dependent dihydropyrimidine dehydrogenase PreA subunit
MTNVKKWEEVDHWVEIDIDLCNGKGECVNICPMSVYEIIDDKVEANNIRECIECGACQDVCPSNAILRHWAWD